MDPDFYYFLRCKGLSTDELPEVWLKRLEREWQRSKKKGQYEGIYARKRRRMFGPGRFHAASSAGVYLNKNFVKGWRGINPAQP